jgi:peptidoglycan/LPS O-acetylase OafA/YrhL
MAAQGTIAGSTPTRIVGSGRSVFLDLVRLEMAVFVLFSHSFGLFTGIEPGALGASLGGWAVRVFFVLSGWLVAESWRRDANLVRFAIRRVARIAPGFWVAFAISVALGIVFGGGKPPITLLRDAALLYPPQMTAFLESRGAVVNAPMWSIDWEMACYAATPILALVMRGWLRLAIPAVVVALAFASGGQWILSYVAAPYCLGVILAGIPIRLPDVPVKVPDMSYGVYLYGWPAQKVLIGMGVHSAPQLFITALPFVLAAGYLSHRLVERPAMRLAKTLAEDHKAGRLRIPLGRANASAQPTATR